MTYDTSSIIGIQKADDFLWPGQLSHEQCDALAKNEVEALSYLRVLRRSVFSGLGFGFEIHRGVRMLKEYRSAVLSPLMTQGSLLCQEYDSTIEGCYLLMGRPQLSEVNGFILHSKDAKNFSLNYTRPVELVESQLFLLGELFPEIASSQMFLSCQEWVSARKLKYILAADDPKSNPGFLRFMSLREDVVALSRCLQALVEQGSVKDDAATRAKLNIATAHIPRSNAEYLAHGAFMSFLDDPEIVHSDDFIRLSQNLTSILPFDPKGGNIEAIDALSAAALLSSDNKCLYRPMGRKVFSRVFLRNFSASLAAYQQKVGSLSSDVIAKIDAFFSYASPPVAQWARDAVRSAHSEGPFLRYAKAFFLQEKTNSDSIKQEQIFSEFSASSLALCVLNGRLPMVEAPFFYEVLVSASVGIKSDLREAVMKLTRFVESSVVGSNKEKRYFVKDVLACFLRPDSPLYGDKALVERVCLANRVSLSKRTEKYSMPGYFEKDPLLVELINRPGEPFSQTRKDLFDLNGSIELLLRAALHGDDWVPDRFINSSPGGSPRVCIDLYFNHRVSSDAGRIQRLSSFFRVSPTRNNLIFYGLFLQVASEYMSQIVGEPGLACLERQVEREADFCRMKLESFSLSGFGDLLKEDPLMRAPAAKNADLGSCQESYSSLMRSLVSGPSKGF